MHPDLAKIPRAASGALTRAFGETVPANQLIFFVFHSKAVVGKERLRTNAVSQLTFLRVKLSNALGLLNWF